MITTLEWRKQPRFSTQYKIAGTEIFRLGSTKILSNKHKDTIHGNFGGNAQNKNKDIRRYICVADEDKTLGQVDESGADALIVAYLCRPDSNFRQLFINGIKPHTYCAATIFEPLYTARGFATKEILNLPIAQVKQHPQWKALEKSIKDSDNELMRYYFMGKKVIHGSNYAMRGNTMASAITTETDGAVNLSGDYCNNLLETWHKKMPEIRRDFHTGTISRASKQNGFLHNLFMHPREFTGIWGDAMFREMYAFTPASTVALIIHYAVCEIQEDIYYGKIDNEKWGIDLLQNGHDSLLFQCWTQYFNDVVKYIQPKIERELINFNGEKFKMKSEVQKGLNWGNKKEYNPDGLEEYFVT